MNYKKFIKSRAVRIKTMQAMSFIPDKWMVSLQYKVKTGRKLNLKNPQRFTEKLQWYKLYYRDPLMKQCVDKYDVRKYVKECGLSSILNECYGVYNSPNEIDFSKLPNSFVLKDTLGGGGNSVIIVPDKSKLNIGQTIQQLDQWVAEPVNVKHPGREWVYDGMRHRIVVEKFIASNPENGGLFDYKFFCFGGKVYCLYVMRDRGVGLKVGIYDRYFHKMSAYISYDKKMESEVEKPENFEKMCKIAERLSARFPHARIDLFDQNGVVTFGEITFFSGSGYTLFDPDDFDYKLGSKFQIDYVEG